MDKKVIGILIAVVAILCLVGIGTMLLHNKNENDNQTNNGVNKNNTNNTLEENNTSDKKVLVVYFSATHNTENVAKKIAENLNGDIFEIVPKEEYTSEDLNWTNENSRVSKEHTNELLRNVELKNAQVENWESYDTIIIGYPIWWGIAAWPVNTFIEANNFNGKTVIPFCTSASSGLGESGKLLEEKANGGTWLEGMRFSSSAKDAEIKSFTDSIK